MELIRLSDMLGFRTLQDWLFSSELGASRVHEMSRAKLSETRFSILLYLLSLQVAPFSVICLLHQQKRYIALGATELHILHSFTTDMFGIAKGEWPFSTPFPSNQEICFWSDFDAAIQKKILTAPIHSQYIYAENRHNLDAALDFFSKYLAPFS